MAGEHRSGWRQRAGSARAARYAIYFGLPLTVGLVVAAVVAFTGGGASHPGVAVTPLGATQSPAAAGDPTAPAAATGGPPIITDAANVNCDIIIPANALTAAGLATPYLLTGPAGMTPAQSGCEMTNAAALGAFVQATILDPATGRLSVYDPLVITKGTTPAIAPVVPNLPAGAVVTINFGFNGTDLFQVGATKNALKEANCVNGMPKSIFGQVSFCNGTAFFNAVRAAERAGRLRAPSAGTSAKMVATDGAMGTGKTCPTTRNFEIVDQDPSDNVTTEYLLNPATGQTMQDNASNASSVQGATLLLNGSDNTLLDLFIDPVLGCVPMTAPDLSDNGLPTTSQALDEILAGANPLKRPALVPENDEMVLTANNTLNAAKTDAYRAELGEDPVDAATNQASSPEMYCLNMIDIQTPFLAANQALLEAGQPPVAAVGSNLLTFLANRLTMSFTNLGCQKFGLTNPVTVTLNGQGVAIAATFNTRLQKARAARVTDAMPANGQRMGRAQHLLMDPSGM